MSPESFTRDNKGIQAWEKAWNPSWCKISEQILRMPITLLFLQVNSRGSQSTIVSVKSPEENRLGRKEARVERLCSCP